MVVSEFQIIQSFPPKKPILAWFSLLMSKNTTVCPTCGVEYQRLGQHFAVGSCERPELTAEQRDMADFLLLRGATVETTAKEPRLRVVSASREFLEVVTAGLGWVANDVYSHETAESAAERLHGQFGGDYDATNINDLWAVSTVPHDYFRERHGAGDVTELRAGTARHLIRTASRWVGGPIGTLQFDVSAFDVSGDHLKRLLRDSGVARFCDDSKAGASPAERGHYDPDVVAVPHFEALALIQRVGFEVTDAMEHLCPQVVRGSG